MPKVSVIMAVYNGEKYLAEAIDSVLVQDFIDFEFIIIDDGSTDRSLSIIKSFTDTRIKLISRENRGLISSLNEALLLATGEYIARMDADDICRSDRLRIQLDAFNNNKIALLGSWATKINETGEEIGLMSYPPLRNKEIKRLFIFHNPFIHSSIMIGREALDAVGTYNINFKYAEDYELWSRVLARFEAANISEPLIKYRMTDGGETRRHNLFMRYQGLRIRILGFFRLFFNYLP